MPKKMKVIYSLAILLVSCPVTSNAMEDRMAALAQSYVQAAQETELWPGFNPLEIPLVVFDGENTFAFRHPAPPEGFAPVAGSNPSAHVYSGRHPKVVANSSATIGDVSCATLVLGGGAGAGEINGFRSTATALHEAFHVYQRRTHQNWMGNDMDLFLYPVEEEQLLVWRRLETVYLRRACAAAHEDAALANARLALSVREKRFSAMSDDFSAYERGTELNEGLATYVEYKYRGLKLPELPEGGYESEGVRLRCYQSGLALGLLLDRFVQGWEVTLENNGASSLDELLLSTIGRMESADDKIVGPELALIKKIAREETSGLVEQWQARRQNYLEQPGWSLVIESSADEPLNTAGFDPWNVKRAEGAILHTRFLKLKNSHGELELMGGEALTEGAGAHPLFNGINRMVMTGLAEKPQLTIEGEMTNVSAPAIEGSFRVEEVECKNKRVVLRLGGNPQPELTIERRQTR